MAHFVITFGCRHRRMHLMTNVKRARAAAERQRRIQSDVEQAEKTKSARDESAAKKAVQAGPRMQPENPLPPQHQRKPGKESELRPSPRFLAPAYVGSGKLHGMACACGEIPTRERRLPVGRSSTLQRRLA